MDEHLKGNSAYILIQKRIKEFLIKYKEFFIISISQNYPLKSWFFEKYTKNFILVSIFRGLNQNYNNRRIASDFINGLSKNENLLWTIELIEKNKDIWRWYGLSNNKSLPWSDQLIDRFKNYWDWNILIRNESISWTIKSIEKYENYWKLRPNPNYEEGHELTIDELATQEYSDYMNTNAINKLQEDIEMPEDRFLNDGYKFLQQNKSLPWSIELIEKYKYKWNWDDLSMNVAIPWSVELIEKFINKWNWDNLSINNTLPWSDNFIERFLLQWNWSKLSGNESIPWSIEFIQKFETNIDWSELSGNNSIPWSVEFLEKYETKLDFNILHNNPAIPWTQELIEKFKGDWNWYNMKLNDIVPWSEDLIYKYVNKFDFYLLSNNELIRWSPNLIEKYFDKWNWGDYYHVNSIDKVPKNKLRYSKIFPIYGVPDAYEITVSYGLSANEALPWSIDLINKFSDKWKWDILSFNHSLPWNLDLIDIFIDKWDWDALCENDSLPWSLDFLEKYDEHFKDTIFNYRFPFPQPNHNYIWNKVFAPFMNDDLIDEIMTIILTR